MTLRGKDGKFIPNPKSASQEKRYKSIDKRRLTATQAQAKQSNEPLTKQLAKTALAKPEPTPPAKKLVNRIALVLDASISMQKIEARAREFANAQISKIKLQAQDSGQATYVSVLTFGDPGNVRLISNQVYFQSAPTIDHTYRASDSSTALFDAVREATNNMCNIPSDMYDDVSYLVIVLTDGEENSSRYGRGLPPQANFSNWSYVFLGPRGCSRYLENYGVPAGNIKEWDGAQELDKAAAVTSDAIGQYYSGRSVGKTRTDSFFTDLSDVKKKDLNKLTPVTGEFTKWRVERECEIREFVESHNIGYQIGRAFYELTKSEKIQSHKEIVIMDKTTKALYGGQAARELVGITAGPGVTVRVTPGNHANFSIFVSSTSTNRKLVRGTNVLYRK